MYDFDALVGELLAGRPELTREELLRRIEEKKRTVGAGYLTDQGALFLVAGELGVSLKKDEASSDMRISDLYIGANDVTVVARVLAIYPVATYNKKDGGQGRYRRLALFDGRSTVRLTVWEEGLEQVERSGIMVDGVVRVANGYVKQGLDGRPNLNLGRRGKLEPVADDKLSARLPSLQSTVQKLPNLTKEESFVALEGVVGSEPRYSEFVRSDGSEGSLFQFGLVGSGGKETRVVVWSPAARPDLKRGERVQITNLRARRSNSGEYEVHGDAGSTIIVGPAKEKILCRIAATTSSQSAKMLLAAGRDRRIVFVEIGKGVKEPSQNQVAELEPDDAREDRIYCRSPGSVTIVEDDSFPGLQDLTTKLQEVKEEDA